MNWIDELSARQHELIRSFILEKNEQYQKMKTSYEFADLLRKDNLDMVAKLKKENELLQARIVELEAKPQLNNI